MPRLPELSSYISAEALASLDPEESGAGALLLEGKPRSNSSASASLRDSSK